MQLGEELLGVSSFIFQVGITKEVLFLSPIKVFFRQQGHFQAYNPTAICVERNRVSSQT